MQRMTLAQVSHEVGGRIIGNPHVEIHGVSGIKEAMPYEISFVANRKYRRYMDTTAAGALIVGEDITKSKAALLQVKDPMRAYRDVVLLFHPIAPLPKKDIHPTAVLGRNVSIGQNSIVEAHAVIEDNVVIGRDSHIRAGVFIGKDSKIGANCVIHPNVTIYHTTTIGNNAIIHAGAVIGSDGFGYALVDGQHTKILQVGVVIIEDDVEIGANTTVDRAALNKTFIGKGTKIDNLVQIAHNVVIGRHTVIAAQAGIAGSTEIGSYVAIGGQGGIGGHITVGDKSKVAGQAGVTKDVQPSTIVSGYPAREHRSVLEKEAALEDLPKILKEFKALKLRVAELENREKESQG